jgi:hypothetical protein
MANGMRFSNLGTFQSVDNMNPIVRAQQYGFNGRIFLDPFVNPEPTTGSNSIYPDSTYTSSNGKIQIEKNESSRPYDLFKNSSEVQDTNVSLISNIVQPNALSRTFFSNDNVDRLQRQIINQVYKESQQQIGRQSYQELQVIMKSIYLQYSRNLPTNIEEQVQTLNKYVVDECVRIVVPNVLQYSKYIEDITSPIPIMPRSQNVSNKGYKFGDFSSIIPSTINTSATP